MNPMQNAKFVSVTPPGAINDNTAWTTAEVDTAGFGYAVFTLYLGASDIAMAVFKLQEGDTSGSATTDIPGADFSVSPLTLPAADDDNSAYRIFVDLGPRKRYLNLSITAGNGSLGTYAAAWCDLLDPVQGVASDPQSWRKRGLGNATNPATIAQAIV